MAQAAIYTANAKALRDAVTSHADWKGFMAANPGLNSGNIKKDQCIAFLEERGVLYIEGEEEEEEPAHRPAPMAPRASAASASNLDLEPEELELIERIRAKRNSVSEERVIELIRAHAGTPATVNVIFSHLATGLVWQAQGEAMHHKFPLLLAAISAGVNVMLVGPAGSGKTTACEKAAQALGLAFYFTGAIQSEYKLTGFVDAQGRIVSTAFRRAYENGGLFLFDENDASSPSAVLAFNAALANSYADFPDGAIARHENFRAVAACNTFGLGASRQYVGRFKQDAAALDRYATIDWDYDAALEAAMIGLGRPAGAPVPADIAPRSENQVSDFRAQWFATVTKTRAAIADLKIEHVVSPRATVNGIKLYAAGWPVADIEAGVIWKGLDAATVSKVRADVSAKLAA